jgi:DNA-binding CsgD family transcriptional regulator
MPFLNNLLQALGLINPPTQRQFELSESLQIWLEELAAQECRPVEEVTTDLIQQALELRQAASANLQRWRELSPRQQDIAALTCLGYTNQQIAIRLHLSPETIKTHLRAVLQKYGVKTKFELRQLLADLDFSAFEPPPAIPPRG